MAQQAPTEVGFYPTQDYIEKNWAPTKVSLDSLRALAKSQAEAEHHGILDSETTKYYLPSALTEGRWTDYGVNHVDLDYGSNPKTTAVPGLKKADEYQAQLDHLQNLLAVSKNPNELNTRWSPVFNALETEKEKALKAAYSDETWPGGPKYQKLRALADKLGLDDPNAQEIFKGTKFARYYPTVDQVGDEKLSPEAFRRNAALKTLALANKVSESGKTGLDAWQAYNGAGPLSREYKKKVAHTYDMMEHPANKDMWNAYQNMVKQYKLELKYGKK